MARDDLRTDVQLAAAANNGEEAALAALYLRHRDWVVRLAYRFTTNDEDALDVLQETFSYLCRKFPGFQLTASMTTFLYPVVKNLSIAARRKRGRGVSDDDLLQSVPAPTSPAPARLDDLKIVLSSLPDAHREVILMRFIDAMTLEEIASALNIPLGTVKSRLHNALATLRADPRTQRYFNSS